MKKHEHAKDFQKCEICSSPVKALEYDSPLYCEACILGMEKLGMSPSKYRKYLELAQTIGKK